MRGGSRSQPPLRLEPPRALDERPAVLAERAMVLAVRGAVLAGESTVLLARPTVLVDRGTVLADRSTVLAGRPTVLAERSAVLAGRPTVLADRVAVLAESATVLADMTPTLVGDSEGRTYSLIELARATGVSIYRIRHWVRRGWLHPAHPSGSNPRYADDHVERVRAVAALRRASTPSSTIDAFVRDATRDEIRRSIGLPPLVPAPAPATPHPPSTTDDPALAEARLRANADALVCLAAEQLDTSPRGLRVPLARVLKRLVALRLDAAEVARVLEESGANAT